MANNPRANEQKERNQTSGQRGGERKGMEPTRSNTPGSARPEGKRSNERMDTPRKQEERSRGGAGSSGTVQEYTEANRDRGTRGSKEDENRDRGEERRRNE